MRSLCIFCLLIVSSLVFVGCGPATYTVTGTVTFEGTPVAEGEIVFLDAAGKNKSYGGQITDGEYSFESSPGKKTVEISVVREVPGEMDTTSNPGESVRLVESYIPETELTAEVRESGDNKIDFTLEAG